MYNTASELQGPYIDKHYYFFGAEKKKVMANTNLRSYYYNDFYENVELRDKEESPLSDMPPLEGDEE